MVSGQIFPKKTNPLIRWLVKKNIVKLSGWWVVWNMAFIFHHIWDVILPIDPYFSRWLLHHQRSPTSFLFFGMVLPSSIWLIGIKNGIIPWWIPFHSSSFLGFLSFFHSPWISDMPPGVAAMSRMAPRVKSSTKWGPLCLLSWFINHELITINYSYIMLYLP